MKEIQESWRISFKSMNYTNKRQCSCHFQTWWTNFCSKVKRIVKIQFVYVLIWSHFFLPAKLASLETAVAQANHKHALKSLASKWHCFSLLFKWTWGLHKMQKINNDKLAWHNYKLLLTILHKSIVEKVFFKMFAF